MPKRKGSPGKFVRDPEVAKAVEVYASFGVTQVDIGKILKIRLNTLKKHFPEELALGQTKANAKIAGALFRSALEGNTTAQIFWLKTRAGWKDTTNVEVSGPDGKPLPPQTIALTFIAPNKTEDLLPLEEKLDILG